MTGPLLASWGRCVVPGIQLCRPCDSVCFSSAGWTEKLPSDMLSPSLLPCCFSRGLPPSREGGLTCLQEDATGGALFKAGADRGDAGGHGVGALGPEAAPQGDRSQVQGAEESPRFRVQG